MQFSLRRLMIAVTLSAVAAAVAAWLDYESMPALIALLLQLVGLLLPGVVLGLLVSNDPAAIALMALLGAWTLLVFLGC